MTLLLCSVTAKSIVLGADGAEFRHDGHGRTWLDKSDRQKITPVDNRAMAIGVHGQNLFHAQNSEFLVVEEASRLARSIGPEISVRGFCQSLFDQLNSAVNDTFRYLSYAGIQQSPLGIFVVGYDKSLTDPQCYEAWWTPPDGGDQPSRIKNMPGCPVFHHSGSGAGFAIDAILRHGYPPERLMNADTEKVQRITRAVYQKANSLQPADNQAFGGRYHEVTITRDGAQWSQPPLSGCAKQVIPKMKVKLVPVEGESE